MTFQVFSGLSVCCTQRLQFVLHATHTFVHTRRTNLIATAKPCMISPALGPTIWMPSIFWGLSLLHITCTQILTVKQTYTHTLTVREGKTHKYCLSNTDIHTYIHTLSVREGKTQILSAKHWHTYTQWLSEKEKHATTDCQTLMYIYTLSEKKKHKY